MSHKKLNIEREHCRAYLEVLQEVSAPRDDKLRPQSEAQVVLGGGKERLDFLVSWSEHSRRRATE